MMIDFFGTTPGLLSLAGLALVLILVSILRRLVARARARRSTVIPASSASAGGLPRWAVAAIAVWAAQEGGGGSRETPSAAAWAAAGGQDPWLAWIGPARRNVGVTK